jgi:MFS transporter, ACS family, hexuronate transporter
VSATPQAIEQAPPKVHSLRWLAVLVFVSSSTLNYLDRLLLLVLAPLILSDLHLTQTRFSLLISIFSLTYAGASLVSGWLLDRFGVNATTTAAVAWWSCAAIGSAFTRGLDGLAFCRGALGIGESVGVPAVGKLNGLYLKSEERALGAAVNQIGLSLGASLAPVFVPVALAQGWRMPFLYTGLLGFVWIPLWFFVSRKIRPATQLAAARQLPAMTVNFAGSMLRNRNLLLLTAASCLWMVSYSLWSNWTPLYLVNAYHLTVLQGSKYVWIPPLISNVGGFFGGYLSWLGIKRGMQAAQARRRAVWFSAVGALSALSLPLAPDARWGIAAISAAFFFSLAGSVNIYALPIDLFGPERTGFAIAVLTCGFGVMQAIISPLLGYLSDHKAYTAMVWIATIPLLLGAVTLRALDLKEAD